MGCPQATGNLGLVFWVGNEYSRSGLAFGLGLGVLGYATNIIDEIVSESAPLPPSCMLGSSPKVCHTDSHQDVGFELASGVVG